MPAATERFGRHGAIRAAAFAPVTACDIQTFHLDDAAAAANPLFGRLAISGWRTTATGTSLVVGHRRNRQLATLGGPGVDELRWLALVHSRDVVR